MVQELPVLAEVLRGGTVESRHRGSAAVVDATGRVAYSLGDPAVAMYPRSAIKPIQAALAMAESGAMAAFGLTDRELALAAASHSAEAVHVEAVLAWLDRLGLAPDALECGTHDPGDPDAMHDLWRAGATPGPQHNNCSGKHTAFLTVARHMGVDPAGYLRPDHPAQRRVLETMSEMCDHDLATGASGTDGCGVPTLVMPLKSLALGMARLADPAGLAPARAAACRDIVAAMAAHPVLVAGTRRHGTALLKAGAGRFVAKGGAEGVFAAAWPEKGLGIAIKVEDGAGRAAQVAVNAVLEKLGALDAAARARLGDWYAPTLRNWAGTEVGRVRPGPGFG